MEKESVKCCIHLPDGIQLQGGKYRIVRFIGSGGFGCTYEAEHTGLGEKVAIKEFFVRDFCNRDGETSRISVGTESKKPLVEKLLHKFMEEAKALYRLRHPGIVRVSDVFEENGTAYYVMDYIEGCSLQELVNAEGPLPEDRALKYIRLVSNALSYVHSQNRLHLDLKPGNIMVDENDNAVLIDFGASKQYDEESGENTSTLMGRTPGYAPPEQMSNKIGKFLPATDIYALGATLYKCLTGETPLDSMDRISGEDLAPLPLVVSASTRKTVLATMELNKSMRPQSVEAFLIMLDESDTSCNTGTKNEDETELVSSNKVSQDDVETSRKEHTIYSVPQEHGYVDMGLSVKWATCNVGAVSQSDYGNYYAWGETSMKSTYDSGNSLTFEVEMGDISGSPDKDVARSEWGGNWRMPTKTEMEELEKKCKWLWTCRNGVDGYLVTGPRGLSIFLPSSGTMIGSSSNGVGTDGCYWSSSPSGTDRQSAYCISFDKENINHFRYRCHGASVRPVMDKDPKSENKDARQSIDNKSDAVHHDPNTQKWIVLVLCVIVGLVIGFYLFRPLLPFGHSSDSTLIDSTAVSGLGDSLYSSTRKEEIIKRKRDSIRRITTDLKEKEAKSRREATELAAALKRMQDSLDRANKSIREGRMYQFAEQTSQGEVALGRDVENGHEWIDLGLSVKWAKCNVGASSPSEYGNYYAWGGISPWPSDSNASGVINIGDISGDNRYDVARANWGGSWRMPTKTEMKELVYDCSWEWVTQNGRNGYLVSGPNGASIFLPATGWYLGGSTENVGEMGYYWTSTPSTNKDGAFSLGYSCRSHYVVSGSYRTIGASVRPVKE